MKALLLVICVVGAEPSLDLKVNRAEILQRDHLVCKAVLANRSSASITINTMRGSNLIRYQQRIEGRWIEIAPMSEQFGACEPIHVSDPILESGASYTEYDRIMLAGNRFVFERPGAYELRAVAQCSDIHFIESQPVKIVVKRRAEDALNRIAESVRGVSPDFAPGMTPEEKKQRILASRGRDKFWKLGATEFEGEVGEGLQQLEDVGGNIASGIKNLMLMERILSGQERTGDNVLASIRERMDPLNAEVGFHILGRHYAKTRDWEGLAKVVDALPYESREARQWSGMVERHLYAVPRVVVPHESRRE